MASTRETALAALATTLAALEVTGGPTFARNQPLPVEIPAGGHIAMADGDPGEPEVTLSPPIYRYEHRAELVAIVQDGANADRTAALDTLIASIGTAIAADRTLGGAVDHAEAEAPEPADEAIEGAAAARAAIVPVVLTYDVIGDPLA